MNLLNNKIATLKISKMNKLILILVFLTISGVKIFAQAGSDTKNNPRHANISLIALPDADSVVLRWAPVKAGGWVIANQIGYVVERIVLDQGNDVDVSNYVRLTNQALKPLNIEEWKSKSSEENFFSAVAAQAVYGESFNPRPLDSDNMNVLRNAADELTNRYSFALFAADNDAFTADALGLRFVDTDVENGKKYAYRVCLAEQTEQYSYDTAYVLVDTKPLQKSKAPVEFRFRSGDGSIKLTWQEKASAKYSGYYIFRSDDDGKNFKKLNKMPVITVTPTGADAEAQQSFIDTLTTNYKKYIYRVQGVTPFAELSDYAQLEAFSKDLVAPNAPTINKPEQISGSQVKISWELKNAPVDLKGFVVSRSENSLHGYQLVTQEPLSVNTTEFIDILFGANEAYYTVAAVDTSGNMTFSVPVLATIIDTVPPAIPTGLTGVINEKGLVTLKWNAAKESNIKGYRVLYSNDPTHDFAQKTGEIHLDTVFFDNINIKTLTKRIYYRIAAVNERYQHSDLSPILTLQRPDVIPPVEAVFADVFVTDSSVQLKWHPSSSEDLEKQILLRRIQEQTKWVAIDTFSVSGASYVDKNIETNIVYEYTVVAIDSSGLSSKPAFPVRARPYDTGKRKSVENLTVEFNEFNKTVLLNWNYVPNQKEKSWYVVYKASNDGVFKEYKSLESSIFEFVDNTTKSGETAYGLVVMTSRGGESEMETVSINIEETR